MNTHLCAVAAALLLAAPAAAAPVQWSGNGHWYELVATSGLDWAASQAAAAASSFAGVNGHLATVTSSDEWGFLTGTVNPQSARAWLGASDDPAEGTVEGAWIWAVGPEAGDALTFTAWGAGEPNNSGGENYLEGWWNPYWNDIPGSTTLGAYIVEYSVEAQADVPLPAAAPLALLGLGALGLVGRRRRG